MTTHTSGPAQATARRWDAWWPREPAGVAHRFVMAGAGWAIGASCLALLVLVPLALGRPLAAAPVGPGRLDAAYRWVGLWGMVSLPLAGALLSVVGAGGPGRGGRALAGAAWWLWQVALVLGLVLILAGGGAPDAWTGAPAAAQAVLVVALAAWALAVWRTAAALPGRLTVAQVAALLAAVVLIAFALVRLLGTSIDGSGQAVALAVATRGLVDGWVVLAGVTVAAAALVAGLRRPLFGRWPALVGLALWLPIMGVAAGWDGAPDLLPAPVTRLAVGATALLVVPGTLLAVALLGALVGRERPPVPVGAAFAVAFAAVLWAGVLANGAASRSLLGALAFTAWLPTHAVVPPLVVGALAAGTATYLLVPGAAAPWPRWHLALTLAAGLWAVTVLWIIGLAGATSGPAAALVTIEARLRLPGAVLAALAALVWLLGARAAAAPAPMVPVVGALAVRPGTVVGAAVIGLVAALFVVLFIPLADPGTVARTARTEARVLASTPLRADGRARYVAEGCVSCHTQRVRVGADDAAYGPPSGPGDYGDGAALTGMRRAGSDLTWVGDRYGSREAMLVALGAHAAGAPLGMPWLWPAEGPTDAGLAIVDYLVGLRSQSGVAP